MSDDDLNAFMRRFFGYETRIFEAETKILEELAAAAPKHIDDPKWLRAAARKELAAAEVIWSLAKKEKELRKAAGPDDDDENGNGGDDDDDDNGGGDGGGGDEGQEEEEQAPAEEFSGRDFTECFGPLITQFEGKKRELSQWRAMFKELAPQLARFVKRNLNDAYARSTYADSLRGTPNAPDVDSLPHACNIDQAHLQRTFEHSKGGAGAGPRSFDPWAGRWRGKWTYRNNLTSDQHHLWDRTRRVGDKWVQPVSQSERGLITKDNVKAEWAARRADLAINTWDEACGITGWVAKRQGVPGTRTKHIPHIGYRPVPGVLIWINQEHDEHCNLWDANNDSFSVYFEWVDERGNYGILGRRFKVEGTSPNLRLRGLRASESYSGEQHGAVYRHP